MKYAHIDADNYILGWYTPEIHSTIPTPNIEVSESVWKKALQYHHNHITNEGVTSLFDPRTPEEILEYDAGEVRRERYGKLKLKFDPLATNPFRWNDLTPEKQQEWMDYRTLLLNLPDQEGFPYNVTWPTTPE